MDFFEKLGQKVTEAYKTTSEKTSKLAGEAKLKLKINDIKSKINDIYKEIGKKVYEKYALNGNLDIREDIETELSRVKELADEIVSLEKQILELSNMRECVKCGNKIEKTSKFCPECGAEQPEIVEQKEEPVEEENAEVVEEVNNEVEEATNEPEVVEEKTESTETWETSVEEKPNYPQE